MEANNSSPFSFSFFGCYMYTLLLIGFYRILKSNNIWIFLSRFGWDSMCAFYEYGKSKYRDSRFFVLFVDSEICGRSITLNFKKKKTISIYYILFQIEIIKDK